MKPLNLVVCGSLVPDPLQTLEPVATPQGPGLKNEQMLPSVLDPWAACALYEAAATITGFLAKSGASLGSSKSLVDMPEAAQAFSFMSHMNQVGQTGATPRHPKGLSTCCHGEEPHVVGWRFVNERRAVNLDANCGWAQGKADVLYVADAFEVMKKVNELL